MPSATTPPVAGGALAATCVAVTVGPTLASALHAPDGGGVTVGMLVGVVVGVVVGAGVGVGVGVAEALGPPGCDGGGDDEPVDVAVGPEAAPEPGGSTVDPPHATTKSDNAREEARDEASEEASEEREEGSITTPVTELLARRAVLSSERSIARTSGSPEKTALPSRGVNAGSRAG